MPRWLWRNSDMLRVGLSGYRAEIGFQHADGSDAARRRLICMSPSFVCRRNHQAALAAARKSPADSDQSRLSLVSPAPIHHPAGEETHERGVRVRSPGSGMQRGCRAVRRSLDRRECARARLRLSGSCRQRCRPAATVAQGLGGVDSCHRGGNCPHPLGRQLLFGHINPLVAGFFDRIHCLIGMGEQRLGIGPVLGIDGAADRQAERQRELADDERLGKRLV
jgi:hypothetical protein